MQKYKNFSMLHEAEEALSSELADWCDVVDCIILELNSACGEVTEPILVDDHYVLRPAKEQSFNDTSWLPPTEDCN